MIIPVKNLKVLRAYSHNIGASSCSPLQLIPGCLQGCKLDAILVLRVQNGNDVFLSVTGTYRPSFFGVSLQTLALLPRWASDAEGTATPASNLH